LGEADIHRAGASALRTAFFGIQTATSRKAVVAGWGGDIIELRFDYRRVLRDELAPRRVVPLTPLGAGERDVELRGPAKGGIALPWIAA
jgi:hypothetical protein